MKTVFIALALLGSLTASAATTRNDDSCDIGVAPAATLLLPYFEVDLLRRDAATTIFSITNTSHSEQIAHVTIWTDYAYPVLSFDVFLTGYDVQSINLYDLLALGRIAPPLGTGTTLSHRGRFSDANPELDVVHCGAIASIPPETLTRVQQALTVGRVPDCDAVGTNHPQYASGFATIDVVGACNSQLTPADPAYYGGILRYDNVLTGDYQQIDARQNFAQAAPLVHIRAIPEGGSASERAADPQRYKVNFPRTFYGRYQSGADRVSDARQPLPTVFAARWIAGGPGHYETNMIVWREGTAGPNAPCAAYRKLRPFVEAVTFDDHENAASFAQFVCPVTCVVFERVLLSAGRYKMDDGTFPRVRDAISGWIYLNLFDARTREPAQAWVVTSMRAEGRYSVTMDAAALGSGCSPMMPESEISRSGGITLGPLPNITP